MLKLRRGEVVGTDPLEVEIAGERRRAWADIGLVGPCEVGDEVVCNVVAIDLELGSGGFDIVHVNLTRGLDAPTPPEGVHVIKLNYSSMQHAVEPVELGVGSVVRPSRLIPVGVISLHGQLAPMAWSASEAGAKRIGFIQGAGGALPAGLSRDVEALLERGFLCEQISAGPTYGASEEAISLTGALHAAAEGRGWGAAIVGPGPGILGSESRYGHGGMAALDGCHAAGALGLEPIVAPRMSAGDPRPRHLGISHHTRSVLELTLLPVTVVEPSDADRLWPEGIGQSAREAFDGVARKHAVEVADADLEGYQASGLPTKTMGRELADDRLFYASPLAAGAVLGARVVS